MQNPSSAIHAQNVVCLVGMVRGHKLRYTWVKEVLSTLPCMRWFTELLRPKIRSWQTRNDTPEHLWTKCAGCDQMLFHKDLADHWHVCRHCGVHMRWPVSARLQHLFDDGQYHTVALAHVGTDALHFRDQKRYTDRLKEARHKTGRQEAVVLAQGMIHQHSVVVACFDFDFIGGSMGMAVGQALVQAATLATGQGVPLLIIPSSGGARMQEGVLALMQMPRSVIAVQMMRQARLATVMLLVHPTTGGVAASFASLGDITLAEPGAIIGFTGARVIQETLRQPLPAGFQTAEFQKDHGFVDAIVPRQELRARLGAIVRVLAKARSSPSQARG